MLARRVCRGEHEAALTLFSLLLLPFQPRLKFALPLLPAFACYVILKFLIIMGCRVCRFALCQLMREKLSGTWRGGRRRLAAGGGWQRGLLVAGVSRIDEIQC